MNIPKMMLANVINKTSDKADVMKIQSITVPSLSAGQLLIKTVASSVNPIDTKIRMGLAMVPNSLPATLHTDFSGTVVAIGEGVHGFEIDDNVYGCCGLWGGGSGALAQYQTADARLIAHAPKSIALADSAVLPLVAITAYECLIERLKLNKGDSVLIQSASGGVGHIATQLAVAFDMNVYGISTSDEKCALIERYGATSFNRKTGDQFEWANSFGGFENIFNTVGGASIDDAFAMNRPYGSTIGIAGRSDHNLGTMHIKNLTLIFELMITTIMQEDRRVNAGVILKKIAELVDAGKIKPLISPNRFTLETAGQAQDFLMSGKHNGQKVVIDIA